MPAMTTAKAAVLALATSSLATAAEHRAKHNHRRSPVSGYAPSGSGFAPYGPENSTNLWPTSAAGSAVTPAVSGPMTVTVVPVAASDASAVDAAGGSTTGAAAPISSAVTPVVHAATPQGYVPGTSRLADAQGTCPPGNTLTTTVTQRQTVYVTASDADASSDVAAAATSSSAVSSSAAASSAATSSGIEVSPEDASSSAASPSTTASLVGYQAKAVNNGRKGYQGGQWSQNWNQQTSSATSAAAVAPVSTAETAAAAQSSAATSVAAISAATSAVSYVSSPTSVAASSVVVSTSSAIPYVPNSSAYAAPSVASSSAAAASPSSAASSPQGLAKRGCAYNDASFCNVNFGSSQMNWAYNWEPTPKGVDQTKYEWIPMLNFAGFQADWKTNVEASNATILMSINEPDIAGQANMDVATGTKFYIDNMMQFKDTHQLGAPAVSRAGLEWLKGFVAGCPGDDSCRYDFVPIHFYFNRNEGLELLTEFLDNASTIVKGKKLWLTEVAMDPWISPAPSASEQQGVLEMVKSYLDNSDLIERWSWFMANGEEAYLCDGTSLSTLGNDYLS